MPCAGEDIPEEDEDSSSSSSPFSSNSNSKPASESKDQDYLFYTCRGEDIFSQLGRDRVRGFYPETGKRFFPTVRAFTTHGFKRDPSR